MALNSSNMRASHAAKHYHIKKEGWISHFVARVGIFLDLFHDQLAYLLE